MRASLYSIEIIARLRGFVKLTLLHFGISNQVDSAILSSPSLEDLKSLILQDVSFITTLSTFPAFTHNHLKIHGNSPLPPFPGLTYLQFHCFIFPSTLPHPRSTKPTCVIP